MNVAFLIMAVDQSVWTVSDLATYKPSNFPSSQTQLANVNYTTSLRTGKNVILKKFLLSNFHIIFNSQIKPECFHVNVFDVSMLQVFSKWWVWIANSCRFSTW